SANARCRGQARRPSSTTPSAGSPATRATSAPSPWAISARPATTPTPTPPARPAPPTSHPGAFPLGYLGQTGQITSRQLASSTLATTWSYLTNTDDRRLPGINNVGLVSAHFSTFP